MPGTTDRSIDATLNFADDLGADPSGEIPCDDALTALNTLRGSIKVIVPSGDYTLPAREQEVTAPPGSRRVFTAEGGAQPSFVAPEEYRGRLLTFRTNGGFEGIDIDRTATACSPEIRVEATDSFAMRNVTIRGRESLPDGTQGNGVLSLVGRRSATTITLEEVSIPEGTTAISEDSAAFDMGGTQPGIVVGPENEGTVELRDCTVVECSSRGVDAARSVGPVHVLGGTYRNNNRAQIRLCGPGMYVSGASVGVDLVDSWLPAEAYARTSGITNEALTPRPGARPPSGGLIENTAIWVASGDSDTVRGAYYGGPLAGGMTLRGCDIIVDSDDVPAVTVDAPERIVDAHPPQEPLAISLSNVACRGESGSGLAVIIEGRPNTDFRRSCISLPGDREGYSLPRPAHIARVNTNGACTGPPV